MSIQISLTKDTITPELQRLLAAAKHPKSILGAGAKSVQKGIVKHLVDLQGRGNVHGWPSKHFFSGGPDSVRKHVGVASLTDTSAVITIADARFVHRIEGGTITAKRAKMLAIPLTAEAYAASGKGTLRQSMPGLVIVKTPKGAYLAMPTAGRGKGKDSLRFLFKLVPAVTTKPHPGDMPDAQKLGETARVDMMRAAEILFKAGR